VDDGSAIDNHAVWRYGWERDNRDNFRCQNEDPPNIAQRCAILFPRHYDEDCKGKRTPECTANKWIVENIPNGEYEATIGVRHNTAAFILDMQVNGSVVFNSKNVEIKGKDGKDGAWTESSVKFVVANKKVVITDDCSENCKFSWSRITTFSLKELG